MKYVENYTLPSPCYECAERTAKCHATCERYKAFKESRVEPPKTHGYTPARQRMMRQALKSGKGRKEKKEN